MRHGDALGEGVNGVGVSVVPLVPLPSEPKGCTLEAANAKHSYSVSSDEKVILRQSSFYPRQECLGVPCLGLKLRIAARQSRQVIADTDP